MNIARARTARDARCGVYTLQRCSRLCAILASLVPFEHSRCFASSASVSALACSPQPVDPCVNVSPAGGHAGLFTRYSALPTKGSYIRRPQASPRIWSDGTWLLLIAALYALLSLCSYSCQPDPSYYSTPTMSTDVLACMI
jgi:hypothetical protein